MNFGKIENLVKLQNNTFYKYKKEVKSYLKKRDYVEKVMSYSEDERIEKNI